MKKEWTWSKNESPVLKSAKQYSYSKTPISHEEQIEKLYPKRSKCNYDYDYEYEPENELITHENKEKDKDKDKDKDTHTHTNIDTDTDCTSRKELYLNNMFDFKDQYTRNKNGKHRHKQIENKRSMIIQTRINPYLKKNKYLDDIQTQDNFLRPKNSNIEC